MYAESVSAKRKMEWFGVRTLFRLVALGKPKSPDQHFDPASTLVEDRVVLFRASDFSDAIRQAEREARRYSKTTAFFNIYGQRVCLRFLRATDAYLIGDSEPGAGCEVYSSTAIVPKSVSAPRVINERMPKRTRGDWRRRQKFVDAAITADALTRFSGKP